MKIDIATTNGWRLREIPFPHQQTYATPLADLTRLVQTVLSPFQLGAASVSIEQIILTPHDLIAYLRWVGIEADEGQLNHARLHAENPLEAAALLEHILGDWIDFVFVPSSPRESVIYADHDEYTTVFAATADLLSSLREAMKTEGFQEVENWTWTGPHSPGIEGQSIDV